MTTDSEWQQEVEKALNRSGWTRKWTVGSETEQDIRALSVLGGEVRRLQAELHSMNEGAELLQEAHEKLQVEHAALRAVALNAAYALSAWPTDGADRSAYFAWQKLAQKTGLALRKELGVTQVDAPVWTREEIEAGERLAKEWAYMFEPSEAEDVDDTR